MSLGVILSSRTAQASSGHCDTQRYIFEARSSHDEIQRWGDRRGSGRRALCLDQCIGGLLAMDSLSLWAQEMVLCSLKFGA
jgi:hypothetical protein